MSVTNAGVMHPSPPNGDVLIALRIQEADQPIEEAADRIAAFLAAGLGRVVDTALSSDEIREVVVLGHVVGGSTHPALKRRVGHGDA